LSRLQRRLDVSRFLFGLGKLTTQVQVAGQCLYGFTQRLPLIAAATFPIPPPATSASTGASTSASAGTSTGASAGTSTGASAGTYRSELRHGQSVYQAPFADGKTGTGAAWTLHRATSDRLAPAPRFFCLPSAQRPR
jgi:hypothetical protein